MAEYYVRITDEEPVDMEKGVRFKYNTDGESADFVIVDENSYETLVEAFQQFSTDFESAVNYNLDNLLDNKIVKMSDKSNKIVDDVTDEDSDSISFAELRDVITDYVSNSSFNTLSNLVSNLNSTLSTLVSRVDSIDSSKVSTSQLSTLESNLRGLFNNYYNKSNVDAKLNGKANTTHTHNWTNKKLNNYCTFSYNDQVKLASFRYLRNGYDLNTSPKTIHKGLIPSAYRPKRVAWLGSSNVHHEAKIDSSGDFILTVEKGFTGKDKTISVFGMWQYGA